EVAFPSHFLSLDPTSGGGFRFFAGCEMPLREGGSVALLPMNKEGYTRLCQLITLSKREAPKTYSKLGVEELCHHAEDLLALVLPPWRLETLEKLRGHFFDRLYVPVWKDLTWESLELYRQARELERHHGFTLVATQRPFMHGPERKPL